MANVTVIIPWLKTSKAASSNTDDPVYLGIGGREFCLNTSDDDFETGRLYAEALGSHPSVEYPDRNDPHTPYALRTEDLDLFPSTCGSRATITGRSRRLW